MNLKFKIFVLLMFVSNLYAGTFTLASSERVVKNRVALAHTLSKYHRKLFEENLHNFIKESRPSRLVGTAGHQKAIDYLVKHLSQLRSESATVEKHSFDPDVDYAKAMYQKDYEEKILGKFPPDSPEFIRWTRFTKEVMSYIEKYKTIKGTNIIWEKKGTTRPDEILIITAHFDTIAHDLDSYKVLESAAQPGADDNASGVAALLSLVEILAELNLAETVRVIFFDYEEIGFLGSYAYTKEFHEKLSKEKISGVINLEMLGNDTKKDDATGKYGNMKLYTRKKELPESLPDIKLGEFLTSYTEKLVPVTRFAIDPNGFDHSDHINFWKFSGVPVVTFSQNWEDDFNGKRYHTPNDFAETLNMSTLFDGFKIISFGAISLLFDLK